ncbi:hypothetical protein DL770_001620 [Monosporascus sp. CRB-9-2]|nr:hypothetical protein DL770_001620 [Monosporascus sp. CRB-9-2]
MIALYKLTTDSDNSSTLQLRLTGSASWPGPPACGAAFPASARDDDLGGGPREFGLDAPIVGAAAIDGGGGGGGGIEEVGRFRAGDGSGLRHLVAHPAGRYLHVIMETANELITYELDGETRQPRGEVSVLLLSRESLNRTSSWAAEVALSPSGRYLWASARAHEASDVGYLSMFELDTNGAVVSAGRPGSGAGPWRKGPLFMVPTTTGDGIANSVSPAPWSDEFVTMTDFGAGYVQIWKMTTKMDGVMDGVGAAAVARIDIPDGRCCANVIWYD